MARKLPQPITEEPDPTPGEAPAQAPTTVDFEAISRRVGNVIIENWALTEALDQERRKNAALVQGNLALQERLAKAGKGEGQ